MPFYLFPSSLKNDLVSKDTLVIFWTYEFGEDISEAVLHELRQKIDRYLSHEEPFDKIIFLTHEINKLQFKSIDKFLANKDYQLASSLKLNNNDIIKASFDENGFVSVENNILDFKQVESNIIISGLKKIFNWRGGMIGPSENIHYVLPSGKHSNVFIRIGNILKKGAEINFIGFALLPFLRKVTTNIYCDTSSIAVAAQAAVGLKKIINRDFVTPNIESFNSYNGITDYNFIDSRNSLFLISVSSDNGLANRIFKKIGGQTRDDYIITLFRFQNSSSATFSHNPIRGRILCDLENVLNEDTKNAIYVNEYSDSPCKLCDAKSTAVEIIGDEFLTEKQETIAVLLKEEYLPPWFTEVASKFLQREYIRCHRVKKRHPKDIREIHLDIDKLHKERNKKFKKDQKSNNDYNLLFEKYLNQRLPAALQLIIYLNDEASETIAKQIKNFFETSTETKRKIRLIEYTDGFGSISNALKNNKGAILVVASSISQSHSMKRISHDLRDFHDKGYQVCYFVAVTRTENKKELNYIRNTLSFGKQFKNETNVFDSLLNLYLPDERHRADTPWQQEVNKLLDYLTKSDSKKYLDKEAKKALKKFEERCQTIINSSMEGLLHNLYWKTPKDRKQELTPGFVFLKFDHNPNEISQADVYFTIASVLHQLRTESLRGSNQILLQQSAHQRKVLDPENFNRFNDGVIQSSILRAAHDAELDYSHDDEFSNKMKQVIIANVCSKVNRVEVLEEAAYEFLLALVLEKVKLTKSDLKEIKSEISQVDDPIVKVFRSMLFEKDNIGSRVF